MLGMFVADLDRPWIDTPFLMQGFLIEKHNEIGALREYCKYIYVDADHSAANVAAMFRPYILQFQRSLDASNAVYDWGTTDEEKRGSRGPVLDLTGLPRGKRLGDTARFNQFVAGESPVYLKRTRPSQPVVRWTEKDGEVAQPGVLKQIIGDLLDVFRSKESGERAAQRLLVPKSVKLVEHTDTKSLEQEYPRVVEIFSKAEYTMAALVSDALAGRDLALHDVERVVREMVDSMLRNTNALMLVTMIKEQGASLFGHALRVAVHMIALGRHIGLPKGELVQLGLMGMLLDIGKTALPVKILTKPGRLDDEEFALARTHVERGVELLQKAGLKQPDVLRGIAEHHERENGSGYPKGLKDVELSLYGRIAAMVDCFVALTNDRSYASALTPYYAMRNLVEWSGSLFFEPLVEQFIQAIGVFPVGSIVELSNNEIGVVVSQNPNQRLKPKIFKIWGADKQYLESPVSVDLLRQGADITEENALRIIRGLSRRNFDFDSFQLFGQAILR